MATTRWRRTPGISSIAQLAWLHVTAGRRDAGIGRRLSEALEAIAREAGDERIVVSATPSEHTVTFYRRRGYEVMAEPLPELYEREPDDIHLEKRLQVPPPPVSR